MKRRVLGDSQAGRDMLFFTSRTGHVAPSETFFPHSHALRGNAAKARCAASRAIDKLKCSVSLSRTQRVPSCIPTQRVGTRQIIPNPAPRRSWATTKTISNFVSFVSFVSSW